MVTIYIRRAQFASAKVMKFASTFPQPGPPKLYRAMLVSGARSSDCGAMAEPVRLIESAPAATVALPHNVEAEAALLGALMIDNRLGRISS